MEVSAKADYLFTELAGVREQMAQELLVRENLVASVETLDRELLLKGDELAAKDVALVEMSAKAEVLGIELTGVRDELATKEASQVETVEKMQKLQSNFEDLVSEIRTKKKIIEKLDQELVRVSVQAIQLNSVLTENELLLRQKLILFDVLNWSVKDLHTLTRRRSYAASRKLRLFLASIAKFRINGISIKKDVIPICSSPDEYLKSITECNFTSSEYFEVNQDVKERNINPYSHYQHFGKKENRKIRGA